MILHSRTVNRTLLDFSLSLHKDGPSLKIAATSHAQHRRTLSLVSRDPNSEDLNLHMLLKTSRWFQTPQISQNTYQIVKSSQIWICGPVKTTGLVFCSSRVRTLTHSTDLCNQFTLDCKEQPWTTRSTVSWTMSGMASTPVRQGFLDSQYSSMLRERLYMMSSTLVHLPKRWSTHSNPRTNN